MKFPYTLEKGELAALIIPIRISAIGQRGCLPMNGKIDTGSAVSLLPGNVPNPLGLQPHGAINLLGAFDKTAQIYPTYLIEVQIGKLLFEIEAASTSRKDFLIGRDLLNQLVLHLNGPKGIFEIDDI